MNIVGADRSIQVLGEIKAYILPLTEEEYLQLEKSILSEGCREALVVWEKSDNQLILVDGHNRYSICQKHSIPFKVKKKSFNDLDEVKAWMLDNQMGRRNLTPDQMSYYRGLKYLSLKRKKGGYQNVKSKGQNEHSTSELLASELNVSESTVKRDAKFAEGMDIIGRSNPKLKLNILMGKVKVKKADVQVLSNAANPQKLVIKNEADLYNKAKILREEIMDEVEDKVRKLKKEKIEKAQNILKEREPLFRSKDDRLKNIKGMIISSINKAINEKDIDAIKQLKKLIDKLEHELF